MKGLRKGLSLLDVEILHRKVVEFKSLRVIQRDIEARGYKLKLLISIDYPGSSQTMEVADEDAAMAFLKNRCSELEGELSDSGVDPTATGWKS